MRGSFRAERALAARQHRARDLLELVAVALVVQRLEQVIGRAERDLVVGTRELFERGVGLAMPRDRAVDLADREPRLAEAVGDLPPRCRWVVGPIGAIDGGREHVARSLVVVLHQEEQSEAVHRDDRGFGVGSEQAFAGGDDFVQERVGFVKPALVPHEVGVVELQLPPARIVGQLSGVLRLGQCGLGVVEQPARVGDPVLFAQGDDEGDRRVDRVRRMRAFGLEPQRPRAQQVALGDHGRRQAAIRVADELAQLGLDRR